MKRVLEWVKRRFVTPKIVAIPTTEPLVTLFESASVAAPTLKGKFFSFLKKLGRKRSRAYKGSKKRRLIMTESSGRNIHVTRFRRGENTLAPIRTLMSAMENGHYHLRQHRFSIGATDLVGWKTGERQSMTLVLIVDVSRSTHPYLGMMAGIIQSLTRYFRSHKDRIGLIELAGSQARILNHPTHNYRVVTKSLLALAIHGQTPLADGLQKALAMIQLQQHRCPGSASLAVLLSDCYPEPLSHDFEDPFDEPAYRETARAAKLFQKRKVPLLVVNPTFHVEGKGKLPGERLAEEIERTSGGRLIRLFHPTSVRVNAEIKPHKRDIEQVLSGMEALLGSRSSSST